MLKGLRMMRTQHVLMMFTLLLAGFGCKSNDPLADNAGGRTPADFPELAADVFQPMDGGIALSPEEIKGRNTWNLWCGGDEQFWERMSRESFGLIDLLKTIDSRKRGERFKEFGLINEPGYKQASKTDQYGLWIDEADQPEPAGIDPKVYGHPTGIMGFRLFENPDFKGAAAKKWDGNRYYADPDYAIGRDLVRPYRVGISCGACHIAFNPCKPPADPANPNWANLASAIGNQYIREGRVFANLVKEGGFFWEMLKNQPPGTSDTSRIATDNINNPNAINSIFLLGSRVSVAEPEVLGGETMLLPGIASTNANVPHILKDGADSVGVVGATLRVYVNIGMYSQHFLRQHNALIGLTGQKPFEISTAQKNSVYWLATQQKFTNVGKFFTRLKSYRLEDAPGGKEYLTTDQEVLKRGKIVFAENCARCHSSKQPPSGAEDVDWYRQEVLKPDFRDGNFFSDDHRYPITKIQSNAARACGTNAKRGHVWANFSSETYKGLESPGDIEIWNPYTDKTENWTVPGGGNGYYRTASSANGVITQVTLSANGTVFATLTNAPYQVPLDLLTPGTVTFTATALDNWGAQSTATQVVVTLTGSGSAPLLTNGLRLQLAADLGVTTNGSGAVTSWIDQSLNLNDAATTSTGLPTLITNALNGRPVIHFTNSTVAAGSPQQYMDVPTANLGFLVGNSSAFIMAKLYASTSFRTVLSKTANNNKAAPFDWYVASTGVVTVNRGNGSSVGGANGTAAIPNAAFTAFGCAVNGAAITHYLGYNINGGLTLPGTVTVGDAGDPMRIGRRQDNGTFGNHDIAEILIYDHAVSDAERLQIV